MKVLSDPPAAVVLLDGVNVGRTPLKIEVDAGPHQVTLQSGKATGTFPITAGSNADKFCFGAAGKKMSATACN